MPIIKLAAYIVIRHFNVIKVYIAILNKRKIFNPMLTISVVTLVLNDPLIGLKSLISLIFRKEFKKNVIHSGEVGTMIMATYNIPEIPY